MSTKTHSPREVFLHLLSIITLYMSAFAFGRLWFSYIEKYLPDILETNGYLPPDSMTNDAIRWAIAALIIVFPVYLLITRFLRKLYSHDPTQATRRIRKWLVYLTLFFAAAAIISDLVTLVYRLLGGEITERFILKVLAVLLIASAIFGYYFWELREFREESEETGTPRAKGQTRLLTSAVTAIVAVSVVSGLFVVGSPARERLTRLDERRVNDLQIIQNEIINFWQAKETLPTRLNNLQNDLTGFSVPLDPQTGVAYDYRTTGPLQFELCANFVTANDGALKSGRSMAVPMPAPYWEGFGNWQHGEGRSCFTRTIDPERFPPNSKLLKR